MEKALVCHFYGWTDEVVSRMTFGKFSSYFKAAVMLQARQGLANIEQSNLSAYKDEDRKKIVANLKKVATIFEPKVLKDYREVVSNLAKRLNLG